MALIRCSECGKEVSDKANKCPNCGCPISTGNMTHEQTERCPNCGGENSAGSDYCDYCGIRLTTYKNHSNTSNTTQYVRNKKNNKGIAKFILIGAAVFILSVTFNSRNSTNDTNITSTKGTETDIKEENVYLTEDEIPYLYTDAKKYTGKHVKLSGQIFQEPERDENGVYFQMFQNITESENNTIVGYLGESELDVKNGDYVLIDGLIDGEVKGSNAFGGKIIAPKIIATTVEVSSYQEIVSPAEKIIEVQESREQHGYEIILEKLEMAKNETRIYLTINNNGKSNFSLYSFNAKLVQDKKQYEEQSNWDAEYPEVQTDLIPGTTTSGIICFPAISKAESPTLYLDASSDDWNEDLKEYKFEIKNP